MNEWRETMELKPVTERNKRSRVGIIGFFVQASGFPRGDACWLLGFRP